LVEALDLADELGADIDALLPPKDPAVVAQYEGAVEHFVRARLELDETRRRMARHRTAAEQFDMSGNTARGDVSFDDRRDVTDVEETKARREEHRAAERYEPGERLLQELPQALQQMSDEEVQELARILGAALPQTADSAALPKR